MTETQGEQDAFDFSRRPKRAADAELVYHYKTGSLGHNFQSTSKQAAHRSEPRANTDARVVLDLIRSRGFALGTTDDEIEIATGMRHQTASARRRGLVLKGFVKDSERKRPTRSGSLAIVWVSSSEPW